MRIFKKMVDKSQKYPECWFIQLLEGMFSLDVKNDVSKTLETNYIYTFELDSLY